MNTRNTQPANVYLALRGLLEASDEARDEVLVVCSEIARTATLAAEADALGIAAERDTHCKALLDQAYELFGDCDPAEHFVALLGYDSNVDPD